MVDFSGRAGTTPRIGPMGRNRAGTIHAASLTPSAAEVDVGDQQQAEAVG
jgi:hypothetical protein